MWEIDRRFISPFVLRYGGPSGFHFTGRHISAFDDILDACRHIYIKKHVLYKGRTPVHPQKWALRNPVTISRRDMLLESLAHKIWAYFNNSPTTINNQTNFDNFHNNLCNWFLSDLNAIRSIERLPDSTYGNAQKMINILFKYLACFEDYPRFADLFSYCHMPIDNYILQDLMDAHIPNIVRVPYEIQYVYRGVAQCWHELDQSHYLALLNDYRAIIGAAKNINLSYLNVEFCWFAHMPLPVFGVHTPFIPHFYQ